MMQGILLTLQHSSTEHDVSNVARLLAVDTTHEL